MSNNKTHPLGQVTMGDVGSASDSLLKTSLILIASELHRRDYDISKIVERAK